MLSQFIAKDLDSRASHGPYVTAGCYLLIARSPNSPVAQALRAHAARLASMSIRVRAIFSEVESGSAGAAIGSVPFATPSECRLARDPRLHAAHEQLVLAPDCAWIGDSMRREPSKRDTHERFAAGCPETATNATRSFERMWRIAVPVDHVPSVPLASQLSDLAAVERPEGLRRQ